MNAKLMVRSTRLIPASTLLIAALLKSVYPKQDAQLNEFNATSIFPAWTKVSLIALELLLGCGLLVDRYRRLVQTVTVTFFGVGASIFALVLSRGEQRTCDCFGEVSRNAVSWRSLARNIALIFTTPIYGIDVGSSQLTAKRMIGVARHPKIALGIVGINLVLATSLFYGLLKIGLDERQSSETRRKPLKAGDEIPQAIVRAEDASSVSILDVIEERCSNGRSILIFASRTCDSCVSMASRLPELETKALGISFIWIRGTKNPESNAVTPDTTGSMALRGGEYFDVHGALAIGADVVGTPTAIIVDCSGIVSSRMIVGTEAVNNLLDQL